VARAAVLGRLSWRLAEVADVVEETARVRTIVLDVPDWPGHRAGQHVDVRLTAEDQLFDVFRTEMTTATGVCEHCGAVAQVGELFAYLRGPGTVARCRTCTKVVMVLVEVRGIACVDLRGLARLEQ
jgi:hypothetical protein